MADGGFFRISLVQAVVSVIHGKAQNALSLTRIGRSSFPLAPHVAIQVLKRRNSETIVFPAFLFCLTATMKICGCGAAGA